MVSIIREICDWNEVRDNLTYNKELEEAMLREELIEYLEAEDIVDEADALADIMFVCAGSLYKLTGGDSQKVEDILLAVTAANNLKPTKKDSDGKIVKGDKYVKPEPMIKKILDDSV